MNYTKYLLFTLISMVFISCQPRYTRNAMILKAENLLSSSPDSTFQILSGIPHPEKLSKADYAAWCLHYTHAQNKLHKEIKSDSLIRISISYYKKSELKKQSGTAYYLLGCIDRQHNKNKEALEALKTAEEMLCLSNEINLKGLVEFNLGYVCKQAELYQHSLSYFKKSLKFFRLSNAKNYQAYAYREITDMYLQLDRPFDSVMYFSGIALRLSKEAGDSSNYYSILCRQGELLYDKEPARAKEYILKGYRFYPEQRFYYAAFLAYTYSKLNKYDSARYYLNIAFSDNRQPNSKNIKYLAAGYLAKNRGDYKSAYENIKQAYLIRDSVFQTRIKDQLYRIDTQFDLTRKDEKITALKIETQRHWIIITLLTIAVLVVLVAFLFILAEHKRKQILHVQEKRQMVFDAQLRNLENLQKKELLLSRLQNRVQNTLTLNRLKQGFMQPDKQNEFFKEITKQSTLSEKEWDFYIDEVDLIFHKKITVLRQQHPQLTRADLIVIAFICLELDVPDCCSLLDIDDTNTLYVRRKRIKKHIGLGKEIDLEKWVHEIISK